MEEVKNKSEVLEKEVFLIANSKISQWTRGTLNNSPDYFFKAWASSTGKYHPACTCKDGGLIVHVKRAVFMANRICAGWGISGEDKDIVISATILHDIAKTGAGMGTHDDYVNHPINAAKYFVKNDELNSQIEVINSCIRNHMGLWTPDEIKKPISQYSILELAVYTSDYMATTKTIATPSDN